MTSVFARLNLQWPPQTADRDSSLKTKGNCHLIPYCNTKIPSHPTELVTGHMAAPRIGCHSFPLSHPSPHTSDLKDLIFPRSQAQPWRFWEAGSWELLTHEPALQQSPVEKDEHTGAGPSPWAPCTVGCTRRFSSAAATHTTLGPPLALLKAHHLPADGSCMAGEGQTLPKHQHFEYNWMPEPSLIISISRRQKLKGNGKETSSKAGLRHRPASWVLGGMKSLRNNGDAGIKGTFTAEL